MRLELFMLGVTSLVIYNAYHDNKYLKLIYSYSKYYKIVFYACLGIGIYLILKRDPKKGRSLLLYANNAIKFLPIDKSSMDMLSPIIDFTDTGSSSFMESVNNINPGQYPDPTPASKRMFSSGKTNSKRSVSETKKKYIAAQQNWVCGHCNSQLDHTYEIDHRIRLEYGGGNDVNNLIALLIVSGFLSG